MVKCVGRMYCYYFDDSEETKKIFKIEKKNLIRQQNERILNNRKNKRKEKSNLANEEKSIEDYLLNKKITLKDIKTKKIINIQVVKEEWANSFNMRFSIKSHVAKALKNAMVGNVIKVKVGKIIKEYEVIKIR